MTFTFADAGVIKLVGITGSLLVMLASLAAALVYRGKKGEHYSPLNHFISELGELGVSRLAWLFNAGLITGGAVLLPGCVGLGLLIPGVWSKLALVAGCVTAVSMILVGVFPMNNLKPHTLVAMTYFRAGLVMVILFTLAIALQPEGQAVVPHVVNWAGMLAILAYGSFLSIMRTSARRGDDILNPLQGSARPRFWLLPAMEWAIFFTTVLWFLVVGVVL
jgi:hypothetical membrane protein